MNTDKADITQRLREASTHALMDGSRSLVVAAADELERRTLTPAECEAITWAMVQADADRIATFRGLLKRLGATP